MTRTTNLLAMALAAPPKREEAPPPTARDELIRSLMAKNAFSGGPVYSVGEGLAKMSQMALMGYFEKRDANKAQGERERKSDILFGGDLTDGMKLGKVLNGEKLAASTDGGYSERRSEKVSDLEIDVAPIVGHAENLLREGI